MDRGRQMTPAEYECHYQNELEEDRRRNEQWEQMKRDPAYKVNFEMQEQLIEMLNTEREQQASLG